MEAQRCTAKGSVPQVPEKYSELEAAFRQLQSELLEQKRVELELHNLNTALELQVTGLAGELSAAKEELGQQRHRRDEDRKEISLLAADLARQKNSLEVIGQELESLTYSISHDLRAPLRHVIGFSGVLLEDFGDSLDAAAHNYLDCIVRGARKMELSIEALLKLSRISRQDFRPAKVDLSQIVRDCASALAQSAPERRVSITIADGLSVRADAALLKAAMENLLDNAWKYTGKKEAATIEFGRTQQGGNTVFYLRDNGVGFDMRYADRLFGPFQRMHKEGEFEGLGIGLAAVQRIIHRHGGKIWADAAVDAGATFFFTLAE